MGWRISGNSFYIDIFDMLGCFVPFTVWSKNDNYLPPVYQKNIKITLASISVIMFGVGFVVTEAPLIFFASIGFLCYIVLLFGEVLGWHFARPAVSPMYVAHCVFPIYTYNPATNNIREETGIILTLYGDLLLHYCGVYFVSCL